MFVIRWVLGLISWLLHSLIGLILFAFWCWCVYDCITTRRFRDPNKRYIWLAVLIVSLLIGLFPLGAFAYIIFGREGLRF